MRTKGLTLPTWCRGGGGGEGEPIPHSTAGTFCNLAVGFGGLFFPPGPGVWISTVEPRDARHSSAPHKLFRSVWTLSPGGVAAPCLSFPLGRGSGGGGRRGRGRKGRGSRWGRTLRGGSAPRFVSICTGINLAAVCCLGSCLRDAFLGSGGDGGGGRWEKTPPPDRSGAGVGAFGVQDPPSSTPHPRAPPVAEARYRGAAGGQHSPPPQCPPFPLPAPGMPRAASIIYI